jgi:putative transposase
VAVDSLGFILTLLVSGAHVQDSEPEAAGRLLVRLRQTLNARQARSGRWPRLWRVYADGNYRGSARLWARQMDFTLTRVLRIERAGSGFEKLPQRWVVERTFAWLFNYRRLQFDLEYKISNSQGMLWLANIVNMLRRIWPPS